MNIRIASVSNEHLAHDMKNALQTEFEDNPYWKFAVVRYPLDPLLDEEESRDLKWAIETIWIKIGRLPTATMNSMMAQTQSFVRGFLAGVKSRGQ